MREKRLVMMPVEVRLLCTCVEVWYDCDSIRWILLHKKRTAHQAVPCFAVLYDNERIPVAAFGGIRRPSPH